MRLLLALLVSIGACGFKSPAGTGMGTDAAPDAATEADAPADDAPVDTSIDGAGPMECMASGTMDSFQGNTPCDPWATFDSQGAQTTQSGGKLRVAGPTAATSGTHGGCFATNLSVFGPEGVFISVEQALSGGYTALTAYVSAGTPASIRVQNGTIDIHNPSDQAIAGSKPYVPAQMTWWRMRPVAGGVIGETSPDAQTWTAIGTVMGTPPTTIRIDISAGTSGIVTGAGTAIFDNLDICP